MLQILIALAIGIAIGAWCRRRPGKGQVSAAWVKDRLQLGRDNHD